MRIGGAASALVADSQPWTCAVSRRAPVDAGACRRRACRWPRRALAARASPRLHPRTGRTARPRARSRRRPRGALRPGRTGDLPWAGTARGVSALRSASCEDRGAPDRGDARAGGHRYARRRHGDGGQTRWCARCLRGGAQDRVNRASSTRRTYVPRHLDQRRSRSLAVRPDRHLRIRRSPGDPARRSGGSMERGGDGPAIRRIARPGARSQDRLGRRFGPIPHARPPGSRQSRSAKPDEPVGITERRR